MKSHLEFEHRKQEQKPQKLKLQEQRYNTQNNKEIIKKTITKSKKIAKFSFLKKNNKMKYQKVILTKIQKYHIILLIKTRKKNFKKLRNYNTMLMKNKKKHQNSPMIK